MKTMQLLNLNHKRLARYLDVGSSVATSFARGSSLYSFYVAYALPFR